MIAAGPGWTMHHGDSLAGMRELADRSVDVVITDPPYDENTHRNGRRGNKGVAYRRSGGRFVDGQPGTDERAYFNARDLGFAAITQEQMAGVAVQIERVCRRWSLIFCAIEQVGDPNGVGWRGHLERAGLQYVRTAFWHKLGSTPQFTGDRPANATEAIVIAHRPGRKRWNGGGKHGYYAHPIVLERGHGEVRLHTTQKPLSLMRELVEDFSDEGETVLDAFAGSATTLVACSQLRRQSIGFELDANYFDIACRRLRGDEAKPRKEQPSLFDGLGAVTP